jgi:amino acid permease
MSMKDLSPEKKKLAKELSRRRLSIIGYATALVASIFTITGEDDIFLHALDDYAIVTLSIVALILFLVWRKKDSLADLKRLNNISLVIALVLLVFVIFAFTQEINDAEDFGDDPAQLIFLILLIVNRFV